MQNPSTWLNTWVGKTPPVTNLFGTHRLQRRLLQHPRRQPHQSSTRFATYKPRLDRAVTLMNRNKLDVVGTQEFQETQYDYFVARGYTKTWGAYYWNPAGKKRDTENAVIWRKSKMEFVSGTTFDIPYFNGNIRHVPAVLLREKVDRAHGVLPQRAQPGQRRRERVRAGGPRRSRSSAPRSSSCVGPAVRCSSPATSTTGRRPSAR